MSHVREDLRDVTDLDLRAQTAEPAGDVEQAAEVAGEHGAGFTVVAREIKELADEAKKATAQVRQILGEIQKATTSAVIVRRPSSGTW